MFAVTPNNPLNLQKRFDSSGRRFFAISGAGSVFCARKVRVSRCGSVSGGKGSAMEISSKDKTVEAASPSGRRSGSTESTISSSSSSSEGIEVRATMKIRKKLKEKFTEKIDDEWEYFINGIGRGISIRLVSEDIDPGTNSGRTIESSVRGWLPKPINGVHVLEYAANFTVPRDFGSPGAVLITNLHGKEFYLLEVIVHGFDDGPIFFPANTWIHSQKDNSDSRIIFKNHAYLPI